MLMLLPDDDALGVCVSRTKSSGQQQPTPNELIRFAKGDLRYGAVAQWPDVTLVWASKTTFKRYVREVSRKAPASVSCWP